MDDHEYVGAILALDVIIIRASIKRTKERLLKKRHEKPQHNETFSMSH